MATCPIAQAEVLQEQLDSPGCDDGPRHLVQASEERQVRAGADSPEEAPLVAGHETDPHSGGGRVAGQYMTRHPHFT